MITDDDLLLYYYRDGLDAAERARIGAALAEQPALAQRLHGLVAKLDAAAAALPDVPVPAGTQQRWQAAVERAAREDAAGAGAGHAGRRIFSTRWLAAAAAIAALAILLTIQIARQPPPERMAADAPPATAPVAGGEDSSAYERGLKWHLASTERRLAALGSAGPEERAHLIQAIVAQNRLYALAAERAGEPQLARVLRAFAPLLESLEHGDGDGSADIAQLSFELRVMQGRLGAGADASPALSTTL